MAASLSGFRTPAARDAFKKLYNAALERWPVPHDEIDVPTRFGSTHVIISGPPDAPPVVLLHGFMATATMWQTHIGALSERYRCYCIDTIGDANMSVLERPVSTEADYVTWLDEVFTAIGVRSARVVGLSYGGFLTGLLAMQRPDRVEKAVLLCPAGTLAPLPPAFFLRALPALVLRSYGAARRYWRWFLYHKHLASGITTDLFAAGFRHWANRGMVVPRVFTDDELRAVTVPVTLLIGDSEVVYKGGPAAALKRGERLVPGLQAHLIPQAGHVMTLDNPDAVTALTLAALA